MRKSAPAAVLLGLMAAIALATACASSSKSASSGASDAETRVLSAVVTEREYSGPGATGGGSMHGSGSWYLSFEAQEGDKFVHYRFPVTQQQYFRYPEGTHVEIVVAGNDLREIRAGKD